MDDKIIIKKKNHNKKQKIITILLCISLFCVFSILFLVVSDRQSYYRPSNKIKELTLSEFDNYKIVSIDNDVYIKDIKNNILTKLNIKKEIKDNKTIYSYNDNKYSYISIFGDITDNRLWLFDDNTVSIYDYKEDKIINNVSQDTKKNLSLVKTNNTYFYVMEASDITYNSYYAIIYNKSLTNILNEDYYLILDDIKDNMLYFHNLNYNNKSSVIFFSLNQNGIIKKYRTFDNIKVLGYDFDNDNYIVDLNHKLILKDKNDKEIKTIVDVPLPYSSDYTNVITKISFNVNDNKERVINIRFTCEDGIEEGIYNYEYTYNVVSDKLDLVKR